MVKSLSICVMVYATRDINYESAQQVNGASGPLVRSSYKAGE